MAARTHTALVRHLSTLNQVQSLALMPARGRSRPGLSQTELAILRLEQNWFKYAGAKEARIRNEFGISPTRYYQILNKLIDNPPALAVDPVTVGRLRRLRERRKDARTRARELPASPNETTPG